MDKNSPSASYYECLQCGHVYRQEVVTVCPLDQAELVPVYSYCDPLEGSTLDEKYLILGRCGSGASGTVYRGRHIALNKDVAVKFLHAHLVDDPDKLTRFENEARMLSELSHANIVRVLDYGLLPQPYIVMEFASGKRLDQVLQTVGPFPVKIAIKVFLQICAGMAAVHEQGLIHQDLKPANLVVSGLETGKPEVKILDFGTARLLDTEREKTGVIVGSPPYMSPEQCAGQPTDQRSDVYSTGCVMYEVVTGVRPFEGASTEEYIFKHLNQLPQQLTRKRPDLNIPEELDRVICRTLSKQPDFRTSSMIELARELELIPVGRVTVSNGPIIKEPRPLPAILPGLVVTLIAGVEISLLLTRDNDGYSPIINLFSLYSMALLWGFSYSYWFFCVKKLKQAVSPVQAKKGPLEWLLLMLTTVPLSNVVILGPGVVTVKILPSGGCIFMVLGGAVICFCLLRCYSDLLSSRPIVALLLIMMLVTGAFGLSPVIFFASCNCAFLLLLVLRTEIDHTGVPASRKILIVGTAATIAVTLFSSFLGPTAMVDSTRQLQRLIDHDRKSVSAYMLRAKSYFSDNRDDLAFADASTVVTLDPRNVDGWRLRSEIAERLLRYDDCLDSSTKLLDLDRTYFAAQYRRAWCFAEQGRTMQALIEFRKALKLKTFPYHIAETHRMCAEQLLRLGDYKGCLDEADKSISAVPADEETLVIRARALAKSNDFAATIKACDRLTEFPDVSLQENCIRAEALSANGRSEEALQTINKALEAAPTSTQGLLAKSVILSKSGHFQEALEYALKARNTNQKDEYSPGDCYFVLAQVYLAGGDYSNALACCHDAISLSPEIQERKDLLDKIELQVKTPKKTRENSHEQ